jgi:methionine-rich copper-binding protein CopC
MLRIGAAALVFMLSGLLPSVALSHSHLKKSVPAAGSSVLTRPSEVRLQFNEKVEPSFSKISVEAKGGKAVPSEAATSDPSDKTILIVKFAEPLQPGNYKVNWQAVSADTHKVKGSFTFQVRP